MPTAYNGSLFGVDFIASENERRKGEGAKGVGCELEEMVWLMRWSGAA